MRGGEDVRAEAEWAVSFSCSYFAQVWSYLLRSRWVVTAQRLHRAALVSKTMAESAEEVQVVRKRNQKKKKREDVDSDEAASKKKEAGSEKEENECGHSLQYGVVGLLGRW